MSHHQNAGPSAAGQGNDVQMSHHQITESPALEQDNDVQISNTIDIYRPKTWEQLEGQEKSPATQAATINKDQLP
jgi:hypothetical protein